MKVVMDRDQRDAMYRFIVCDLDSKSIATLLREGKVSDARTLRRHFEHDMWLLDELGWIANGLHERYEVEFSDGHLSLLVRFRLAAEAVISESEMGDNEQAIIDSLYVSQVYCQVFDGSEADDN
jgi:hypothetical protein